jgi:hypothetical protein
MSLNTQMQQIGMFSRSCRQCHAPDKQAYETGAESWTLAYHATDKGAQVETALTYSSAADKSFLFNI